MMYIPAQKSIGKSYNLLTVKQIFMRGGRSMAVCDCECGGKATKPLAMVRVGHIKSCGCISETGRFKKGSKTELVNRFDKFDEATSYWAGFLFGDGNVNEKNKLQVCLTDNHNTCDYLAELSRFIFGINCVNHYPQTKRCQLQVTDELLCANLAKFGIVPRKTYTQTLLFPEGADPKAIIRGYFDADGWFSVKKNITHNWGLCSYQAENLELVRSQLPVKLSITLKRNQHLYEMRTSSRKSVFEIVNYIAPTDTRYCYPYKWDKIWTFLQFYANNLSRKGFLHSRRIPTSIKN